MSITSQTHPHRRLNILTGEWVLVSPQRNLRPWNGKVEAVTVRSVNQHDAGCYLCPGNERASGHTNPPYANVFIFDNDYAALLPDEQEILSNTSNLLVHKSERGICKVICFSPRHDLTMAKLQPTDIEKVIEAWKEEYVSLGKKDFINSVQIFENKGEIMGCSNPHPHGQIWAQESLPVEIERESKFQLEYYTKHNRTLLSDYLKEELSTKTRIIFENNDFAVLVPFWAVWPFETIIISKRAFGSLAEIEADEITSLAEAMSIISIKYDNLFACDFPYSMGLHQAPTDGKAHPEWHFHIHFYPPLLRSSQIKKFMVGYELLGEAQRDLLPEKCAEIIRALPNVHYTNGL
jgi:UDPglucose--hexose-1-phosphate uridylyltransferase